MRGAEGDLAFRTTASAEAVGRLEAGIARTVGTASPCFNRIVKAFVRRKLSAISAGIARCTVGFTGLAQRGNTGPRFGATVGAANSVA